MGVKPRIAIIGAGIGGLTLTRALADFADVTVFEKSRGVGGRMSTRYAEPFYFDHGAQCFTARTDAFKNFLAPFEASGVVQEWSGKVINFELGKKTTKRLWFERHLVASPNMNSLCKAMVEGVDIRLNTEIIPLSEQKSGAWELISTTNESCGAFDWVISTAPPAQTSRLFGPHLPADAALNHATLQGCYALMIGLKTPWPHAWIAAKVRNNPIKWISVNSSKPGRNDAITCLVAHSRSNWAEAHMNDDMNEAQAFLLSQIEAVTGMNFANADYLSTHRWRYAVVKEAGKPGPYLDEEQRLASVSDWCATSRIEEVWLSAMQLVEVLKNRL